MEFKTCSFLNDEEKLAVFELWNNEYPEKLTFLSTQEFDQYLNNLCHQSHLLLLNNDKKPIGWYVDFIREDEKWFAIILDSKFQGKRLGTQILDRAKEMESELNGWVIDHDSDKKRNGKPYTSPLNFYLKNGFKQLPDNRLELHNKSAVKIQWKK
ncbi:GNAT family N-acetyltransferase [Allomuricauda sp. NBRC 101325]|uniref:GNAT family N-acetyltransferase n=1 Tax=Allomuricauda sp. NBRC 101325 TaxID=1113758 RepID=UPI0024A0850B|nr:GNAT family N-acetyltransferase [Muricauda sp. NBRC 101325]GLU44400.1 hypothetical protein Musp01_20240 [Muricauda sp. NBRC 101325]